MKKLIVGVLLVLVVAAGAFWLSNSGNRLPKEREKVPDIAPTSLSEAEKQLLAERQARERAERQLRDFAKASDDLMSNAASREAALSNALASANADGDSTNAADPKADLGKFLSSMMKDPEMKKMIAAQQRMVVGQMYGPLIQKLKLSPEHAQAFKDLLAENITKATELGTSMFSTENVDKAELTKKLGEESKAMEQRVKEFLGEEKYAEYQDYQTTVGERMQLGQFRQELMAEGDPVSNDQMEQILQLIAEEKKAAMARTGVDFPGGPNSQFQGSFGEEQVQKILAMQEEVNNSVQARVADVLSPSQVNAFGRYQSNQLEMVRVGLMMAQKFMGQK